MIRFHQRMATALAEVELTKVADDPFVHIGDVVQLVHLETGFTIAGDVYDQDVRPGEEACSATAAPEIRAPCARNTFVLTKYRPSKGQPLESFYEDDALRYGQKIRLALNPAANGLPCDAEGGPRPLCLFSKPPSNAHYAKYSRKQLVGLTYRDTFETVWQVRRVDDRARGVFKRRFGISNLLATSGHDSRPSPTNHLRGCRGLGRCSHPSGSLRDSEAPDC